MSFGYNFPDIHNSFLETPWLWSMSSLLQWLGVTLELLCLLITHIASSSCTYIILWIEHCDLRNFKRGFSLGGTKRSGFWITLKWVNWGVRLFQSVLVWIIAILYKWGKDSFSCKLWFEIDTNKKKLCTCEVFRKIGALPCSFHSVGVAPSKWRHMCQ